MEALQETELLTRTTRKKIKESPFPVRQNKSRSARPRSSSRKMISYKEAGVNVHANTRWVAAIATAMKSTYDGRVYDRRHGGFAGLFQLNPVPKARAGYRNPMLIGCSDGVGTKVLLAIQMNRLDTIGIDLVAMNVNDLITCGGEPLFFLDYLAVNRLDPARLLSIIEGIAAGCREAGCALLGGETAEMPDLYALNHIDLAGFAVGVVEKTRMVDGSSVRPGDVVLGLPSSGVHSNGYTLVRRLIEKRRCRLDRRYDGLDGPLGEVLLRPTRIYVRAVRAALEAFPRRKAVVGMAHITGGGLKENIARVLPPDCDAVLQSKAWMRPPIFNFLQSLGTTNTEMVKVFNLGIGFVLIVRPRCAAGILKVLKEVGEAPLEIGRIAPGRQSVRLV